MKFMSNIQFIIIDFEIIFLIIEFYMVLSCVRSCKTLYLRCRIKLFIKSVIIYKKVLTIHIIYIIIHIVIVYIVTKNIFGGKKLWKIQKQ